MFLLLDLCYIPYIDLDSMTGFPQTTNQQKYYMGFFYNFVNTDHTHAHAQTHRHTCMHAHMHMHTHTHTYTHPKYR